MAHIKTRKGEAGTAASRLRQPGTLRNGPESSRRTARNNVQSNPYPKAPDRYYL